MRGFVWTSVLCLCVGCGGEGDGDGPGDKADKDAASVDVAPDDTSGTGDVVKTPDAGADAGAVKPDAGMPDSGGADAGPPDTGAGADVTAEPDVAIDVGADVGVGIDGGGGCGPDGKTCDDGEPCTVATTCKDGKCGSGVIICQCIPADLAKKAPWSSYPKVVAGQKGCGPVAANNKCLGTRFCDTSKAGMWTCKVDPKSVVSCPDDGNPCTKGSCDKKTGTCTSKPAKVGTSCEDADPCTENEQCQAGKCVSSINICKCRMATAASDCAYMTGGNKCIPVICDTSGGPPHECKVDASAAVKCADTDNNTCRMNVCDPKKGTCKLTSMSYVKKTPLGCKGSACSYYLSDTKLGSEPLCDDGDPCTASEVCFKGVCAGPDLAQKKKQQSDGDPKNDNDPTGGEGTYICTCASDADCAIKEDGNVCNGTLYCDKAAKACVPLPGSQVSCPTAHDTPCRKTLCDPATGKCRVTMAENIQKIIFLNGKTKRVKLRIMPYPVRPFVSCDDGDSCTVNDHCAQGQCLPGEVNICGCKTPSDCPKGNACTGQRLCNTVSGTCELMSAKALTCGKSPPGSCETTACDPKQGKCVVTQLADGVLCSDGDACTAGDVCKGGSCQAGPNVCLCKSDADCVVPGADACSAAYKCDTGVGKPHCVVDLAKSVVCDKGANTACFKNRCNKFTGGCSLKPVEGVACDDGDSCTNGDYCASGTCVSGVPAKVCGCSSDADCLNLGDLCANYTCVKDAGGGTCAPVVGKPKKTCAAPDGKSCLGEVCDPATGGCKLAFGGGSCTDANPCTADACTKTGACTHKALPDGTPVSAAGACQGGKIAATPAGTWLVAGGEVAIGCNPLVEKCADAAEKPQHVVKLSAFVIDAMEVTIARYKTCVDAGKCKAPAKDKGCTWSQLGGGDLSGKLPVNCVTHAQATAFCAWALKGGRLPTEAEWEKAARGGCGLVKGDCKKGSRTWIWGQGPAATCVQAVIASPKLACHPKGPEPVGSRSASDVAPTLTYDLAGNVREWTADGWDAGFYAKSGASNPKSPIAAGGEVVVRGGSWALGASAARISARGHAKANTAAADLGFRCAAGL